jgi:hypothetical protein
MPISFSGGLGSEVPIAPLVFDGIDLKNARVVSLMTLPTNSKIFVPIWAGLKITAAVGQTAGPTLSVGSNSPGWNDLVVASALAALAATRLTGLTLSQNMPQLGNGMVLSLNIMFAAVATGVYTGRLYILGAWL